jgi:hypothetical protein
MKLKLKTNGDKLAASHTLILGKTEAVVSAVELANFRKVADRLGIEIVPVD